MFRNVSKILSEYGTEKLRQEIPFYKNIKDWSFLIIITTE